MSGKDKRYPYQHADGFWYDYPESPRETERRSKHRADQGYERRKKQRNDTADNEPYNPENDPEVIESRKLAEQKRKEIAQGKRVKQVVHRGRGRGRAAPPPRASSPGAADAETAEDIAAESRPQTANVPTGGQLPPRRAGSGSQAPRTVQANENEPVPDEIGPLLVTKPTPPTDHGRKIINYRGKLAVVRKERERDPHIYERFSSDNRFWSYFQQDFYGTVIFPRKQPVLLMQWIDWDYMAKTEDPVFLEVIAACEQLNIKRIMAFEYPWCNEVICQFYATLYVGKDIAKTMHWMTCGRWYSVSYANFARILGFTRADAQNKEKIHNEKVRSADSMAYMYNEEDHFEVGSTTGLLPFYAYLNRLFRKTLTPKDGDASHILSYSLNLLHRMKENPRGFDVFDFIWEEIRLNSTDPKRGCGYAPYIMSMIENVTRQRYHKEQRHTGYQVRLVQPSARTATRGTGTRRASAAPSASTRAPSPPSSTTASIKKSLAAIFGMCKKNAIKIRKISKGVKKIHEHLGLEGYSTDSSIDEPSQPAAASSSSHDEDDDEESEDGDE